MSIILSLSLIGCDSSIEKRHASSVVDEVYEWFYIHRSIEYKKSGNLRNEEEKNEAIKLRKLSEGLGVDWNFIHEELKLNEITWGGTIFEYAYFFENKQNEALRIYVETFYYDIASILPIPLKKRAFERKNEERTTLYSQYLWDGDFYSYMKHYFKINMTLDEKDSK